jgi:ubiquinone/menaquinone biosynthesis C-methylase UbiE
MPTETQENSAASFEEVSCPVCSVSDTETWVDEGRGTKYVKCTSCHTVFASPRRSRRDRTQWLTTTFDLDARAFDNAARRKSTLMKEARIILQYASEGRICDVGCGLGDLFEFFDSNKFECHGVELSPGGARFAAEKHHARVHAGMVQEAKFPTSFFDIVTSLDTFYYVDNPRTELEEYHRILKPGGLLVLEIPGQKYQLIRNGDFLSRVLDHRPARMTSDSAYINWFPLSALNQLLEATGFKHVAAYVVPSPDMKSPVQKAIARLHYSTSRLLSGMFPAVLDYSPKYMCIYRRSSDA